MTGKDAEKVAWVGMIAAGLVCMSALFLWGKMFVYSPIQLGFAKHELARSIIYVQNGAAFKDYKKVDAWIPAVEAFHDLKFVRKPVLFFFRDRNSYLQRTTTRARFCAYPNGTLVISPWAVEEATTGKISLEIYLRHELSHTLLYQNMGAWAAYRYPKWLMEGIAVYSANQMGTSFYPNREETRAFIKQGVFLPPRYFKTRKEKQVPIQVKNPIAFIYSEFACIVDYLISMEGRDKFLAYMKRLLKGGKHDAVFREIYGLSFDECIRQFKQRL